jgi:spore germination protein GerM
MAWRWPLALLLSAFVASAAAGSMGARPTAAAAGGVRTTIYFLTDGGSAPLGVRRTIPRRSPYALRALEALLAGPTAAEREAGMTSAIPPGARLVAFRSHDHGAEAVVDLGGLPADADTLTKVRVITQITRTLVGLSGIREVWLRADGEPFGLGMMDGSIENRPYGYDDLLAFFHVCAAKPRTEAVPGECFSALP